MNRDDDRCRLIWSDRFFRSPQDEGEPSRTKIVLDHQKMPPRAKKQCPAWEFEAGRLCWFINGTICEGEAQKNWHKEMKISRSCEVFSSLLYLSNGEGSSWENLLVKPLKSIWQDLVNIALEWLPNDYISQP